MMLRKRLEPQMTWQSVTIEFDAQNIVCVRYNVNHVTRMHHFAK